MLGMTEDALFAMACWVFGVIATTQNRWAVRHAQALQQRYPRAFPSAIAQKRWYPAFLRALGVVLLVMAGIFTFKVAVEIGLRNRA
jgi:hypothetical protein